MSTLRQQFRDEAPYHAPRQLGKTRRQTPEGYLLCEGVPIARTGTYLYYEADFYDEATNSHPLKGNQAGEIWVTRSPEEVFSPEAIASFNGKSVTIDHPDGFVSPDSWKTLTVGTVNNPRRGEGIEDDLLLADLLITDKKAIELVNKDFPDVSSGYDADYVQEGPGRASQRNIRGNHTAILPDGARGRAGNRCSFRDSTDTPIGTLMSSVRKALEKLFQTRDAASLTAFLDSPLAEGAAPAVVAPAVVQAVTQPTTDSAALTQLLTIVNGMNAKLTTMDAELKKMKKKAAYDTSEDDEEEEEMEGVTTDEGGDSGNSLTAAKPAPKIDMGTIYTGDRASFNSALEILAPGIITPTGEKVSHEHATDLFRTALNRAATKDAAGKAAVDPFLMGKEINKLGGRSLARAVNGAVAVIKARNNDAASGAATGPTSAAQKTADAASAPPPTAADLNKSQAEFWNKQRGVA